jgi:hypothetical protein
MSRLKKNLKMNKYFVSFIMKQVAPDCWCLFGACHHHLPFKAWTAFSIGLFAFWSIHIVERRHGSAFCLCFFL